MFQGLKDRFQFVFPAFASLLVEFVVWGFVAVKVFGMVPEHFSFHLLFTLDGLETFLDVELSELGELFAETGETEFAGLDGFGKDPV